MENLYTDRMCYFCNESMENSISFNNNKCYLTRKGPGFKYLPVDTSCHIECYIHECVKNSLNNQMTE